MRSLARSVVMMSLAASLLVGTTMVANAADATWGQVGPYKVSDTRSDPSTLCAYPDGGTRLRWLRVRGPRVDFPEAHPVGWVEWHTLTQRRAGDGSWTTVARTEPLRRTVTLGFPVTFPTQNLPVEGQAGSASMRLIWRLSWFDQGDRRIGGARHAVANYGLVHYGPGDENPVRWQAIERRTKGSCPNRWVG